MNDFRAPDGYLSLNQTQSIGLEEVHDKCLYPTDFFVLNHHPIFVKAAEMIIMSSIVRACAQALVVEYAE